MEALLVIATLLGGLAAIGYFAEKVLRRNLAKRSQRPPGGKTLQEIEHIILESAGPNDWTRLAHGTATTITYAPDVNIRFEMEFEGKGVQARPFEERWAQRFPDKTASGYYCDLYYGSTLLRRFVLVSVDGGRALLPLPRSANDLSVTRLQYKIAKIHDYDQSLETYLKLAKIEVISNNGA
jgi:hypothetical protein